MLLLSSLEEVGEKQRCDFDIRKSCGALSILLERREFRNPRLP
jgi:hypothetical protein